MSYRVLLVAPRTDLLFAEAEVQAILRSGLVVQPLIGVANHADLVRDILTGEYDILWLCTHGSQEGIYLSDGVMEASLLAPLVRNRFSTVVLNTCESIGVAQVLQDETDAGVIATIADVPDQQAFQTGVLFAASLAMGNSIDTAYRDARPGGNHNYVRLAGRGKMTQRQSNLELEGLTASDIRRMVNIVLGADVGWDGVVREIQKIEESLTTKMKSMEQRLESRIVNLESKLGRTPQADLDRKLLIAIMLGMIGLAGVMAWGVYVVANSGGMG